MKTSTEIINDWTRKMENYPFVSRSMPKMLTYFAKQNNIPYSEALKHFGDWLSYRRSTDGNILRMCQLWFIAECVHTVSDFEYEELEQSLFYS